MFQFRTIQKNFNSISGVPGEKVMILPTAQKADIEALFGDEMDQVEMPSGCVYIRTTTNYK